MVLNIFEIHITGEKGINEELSSLNIKNIIVDLLRPDNTLLRTEYMSSFIKKFYTIEDCKNYVDTLSKSLKSKIIRVKIETPYCKDFIEHSLYIESHFSPKEEDIKYPLSRNKRSGKIMATDRTYTKSLYDKFRDKWKNEDIELCIYDSFIEEDKDWFNLYLKNIFNF